MRTHDNAVQRYAGANWFWIGSICIVCSVVMLAYPIYGVPEGYDVAQHLRFAAAYVEAIRDGSFIAVWSAPDNLGFGSVGTRFYPPFADILLALTQLFTNDWYATLQVNSFFWMLPGCIGVYLWLKEFRSSICSTIAAWIYAVLPYHVLQIYQFQLYSEFVASAILPFCFLYATKLARHDRRSDIFGFGLSCSLLVLTHIPSSLIGLSSLVVYSFILIDWQNAGRAVVRFIFAGLITLFVTAFYTVRLVSEVAFLKHNSPEYYTGFYDYHLHYFPLLYNFGDTYWLLFLWVLDLSILATLLIFLPLLGWVLIRKRTEFRRLEKEIVATCVTGVFAFFMLSNASEPIWDRILSLQKIQFPWRFMSVATLMTAASLAIVTSALLARFPQRPRIIVYPILGLFVALLLCDFTQIMRMSGPLDRDRYYEKVVSKLPEESCTCWWPIWAEKAALDTTEKIGAGARRAAIVKWRSDDRLFEIDSGAATYVRVATFYYPAWKATVNGTAVEVSKDENGAILLPVPAENSEVHLYFEEPLFNRFALAISVITWFGIGLWLAARALKRLVRVSTFELRTSQSDRISGLGNGTA